MSRVEDLKDYLVKKYPTAMHIRKRLPLLSELLRGEFDDKPFNIYEQEGGILVSRTLVQGLTKDPTIGVMAPKYWTIPIRKNNEILTVLDGKMTVGIEDKKNFVNYSKLTRYGSVRIPIGSTLHLFTEDLAFYLCNYVPIGK
jgi:uncharacterized protein YaiE (UPF0345 family)